VLLVDIGNDEVEVFAVTVRTVVTVAGKVASTATMTLELDAVSERFRYLKLPGYKLAPTSPV
jgi:hypothetical protein